MPKKIKKPRGKRKPTRKRKPTTRKRKPTRTRTRRRRRRGGKLKLSSLAKGSMLILSGLAGLGLAYSGQRGSNRSNAYTTPQAKIKID
tara:strand:- start:1022 stop:1285 length:264 start_codon:yes stop_codon:yes gene_type:complete